MNEHEQRPVPSLENHEYQYQRLKYPYNDLRLVKVLPDRCCGYVQIEMWVCSTDDNIDTAHMKYHCLSYTWGPEEDLQEVRVNGASFYVRRNLYEFLSQAAQTLSLQPFWIDALSINQSDMLEKSVQVANMGRIYHEADKVVVWLGTDPALLPLARYVQSVPTYPQRDEPGMAMSHTAFWSHPYWTRTCE